MTFKRCKGSQAFDQIALDQAFTRRKPSQIVYTIPLREQRQKLGELLILWRIEDKPVTREAIANLGRTKNEKRHLFSGSSHSDNRASAHTAGDVVIKDFR